MPKWYGSLTSRIMEKSKYSEPQIGMGVTEFRWSDRASYTIVRIRTPKLIEIVEDDVVYGRDGYPKSIKPGNMAHKIPIRWSAARHGWARVGDPQGSIFRLGLRDPYNDPNF